MKRPDEIKIGLECCEKYMNGAPEEECCHMCSYVYNCEELKIDVLALIQQKEQENAEKAERIQQLEAQNDTIMQSFQRLKKVCVAHGTTIQKLKAERDAAVSELIGTCQVCRWENTEKCADCHFNPEAWNVHESKWKWRGVQKEGDA